MVDNTTEQEQEKQIPKQYYLRFPDGGKIVTTIGIESEFKFPEHETTSFDASGRKEFRTEKTADIIIEPTLKEGGFFSFKNPIDGKNYFFEIKKQLAKATNPREERELSEEKENSIYANRINLKRYEQAPVESKKELSMSIWNLDGHSLVILSELPALQPQ